MRILHLHASANNDYNIVPVQDFVRTTFQSFSKFCQTQQTHELLCFRLQQHTSAVPRTRPSLTTFQNPKTKNVSALQLPVQLGRVRAGRVHARTA